jgi:metal-responsive CopG/Arc/MetJ family transcriptional regulator
MVGTVSKNMATKGSNKSEKRRKVFGLSLDQQLMRDIQYLALDQDRYVNDMIEEAARDLLKKYRDKRA